jgi:hypothetical protein
MKRFIVVAVLCFAIALCFALPVTDKPSEMFPSVSLPVPIAHFAGDQAPQTITLYAMRNANFYLDSYQALIQYHNSVAKDATLLAEVNVKLNTALKEKDIEMVWQGTKWGVIGVIVGAATVGVIALVAK